MNLLEIDNIELSFGKNSILNAIYFSAKKGEVTGILGSNGSGKTSLLRIIFGELKPNNKLIRIDNKPILKSLYSKGFIKFLPQFHIFPNSLSLAKAFSLNSLSLDSFLKIYPSFKVLKHTKFKDFSGGERRVIEAYIIIKSRAKIVLLDEPFSHIAPLYIEKIKKIIEEEKHEKIFIITDHLYEHILEISNKTYLLKNGWSKLLKNNKELIFHNYTRTV